MTVRKFKINPDFERAHKSSDPFNQLERDLESLDSTDAKLNRALNEARKSGKLIVPAIGLSNPLPDDMFDFRSKIVEGYAKGENQIEKVWEMFGEEMLTMLDLSDNNDIEFLDERISRFQSLQTMRARNTNLKSLPWNVFQDSFQKLQVLDLQGNRLLHIPLNDLPSSINTLHVCRNKIERIMSDNSNILNLPNLVHLNLEDNNIDQLPSNFHCPHLQHLNLAKNKLEIIPTGFLQSFQNSLLNLNLSDNYLTSDIHLSNHSELMVLEMRNNRIQNVPHIHSNLSNLDLSSNHIKTINGLFPLLDQCDDFGKTVVGDYFRSNLSHLNLEGNQLSDLCSKTMAIMTNLSLLNLSSNDLENLPYIVGYLPQLNKIVLDANPLRVLRGNLRYKDNGTIDTEKLLSSLRKKASPPDVPGYYGGVYENMMNQKIANTPQAVIEARSLVRQASEGQCVLDISGKGHVEGPLEFNEVLNALKEMTHSNSEDNENTYGSLVKSFLFSACQVSDLPEAWISVLPNLMILDGHWNKLCSLPSNFSDLPLREIYLQNNLINAECLRDRICQSSCSNLSNTLTKLDLSSNHIDFVPGSLFHLKSLEYLNLSHNKIKSLTWECDEMTDEERGWKHGLISIETLDLSNNLISDLGYLPVALSGCKQLRKLSLNKNHIYHIPHELGLLTQLSYIDLLGNPQRRIPIRELTKDCQNILSYLRNRMSPDEMKDVKLSHKEIKNALAEEYGQIVSSASKDDSVNQDPIESKDVVVNSNLQERINEIMNELENNISITVTRKTELKREQAILRSQLSRQRHTQRGTKINQT
jgi:Leucine-rich repeat (LRR) protein